jgi:hypothetical protein
VSDYFMNYGPDWPPAPEPTEPPRRRRLRLWQRCAIAVGAYAVIAAVGLIVLHYLQQPIHFGTPAPTSHSATTR